jgi:hypothetical protein
MIGEMKNTWSQDRLLSVHWTSGDDDRLTEYEYDGGGDRILERNYSKGLLERIVKQEGDREVEEIYMNNRIILRAIWEDGRKISEERIRPSNSLSVPPGGALGSAPAVPPAGASFGGAR